MDKVQAFVRGKMVGNQVRDYRGKKRGLFQNKGRKQKERGFTPSTCTLEIRRRIPTNHTETNGAPPSIPIIPALVHILD